MKKTIIFSGIQPSGDLNIGHYISVLSQWKIMQNDNNNKCFFCIADLHSIIDNEKKFLIKKNIFDMLSIFISIGININKNIIFLQSDVINHLKLFWILSSFIKYGEMKRMHQYKKNIKNNINFNIGLFTYPILMASDILLYDTNIVPIGLDQIQHLELTKKISTKFNKIYGNAFIIPKYSINNNICIMSLLDPNKKMSKSDSNNNNYISLLDNKEILKKKINKSVTDSDFPPKIIFDFSKKPGISNLLNIVSNLDNISIDFLEKKFYKKNYNEFKKYVFNVILNKLNDIQKKYFKIRKNEKFLEKILLNGYKKANFFSQKKINEINYLFYKKNN